MNIYRQLLQTREMMRLYHICGEDDRYKVYKAILKKMDKMVSYMCDNDIQYTTPKDWADITNEMKKTWKNKEPPKSTLNPDGVSKKCECGARHTAFPNAHMNYCPLKEWKQ